MEVQSKNKSKVLYDLIDSSSFYHNPVDIAQRSICNIVFTLENSELESAFLKDASSEGLEYLKGHRTVGGMRASIYNPMKMSSVLALREFMVNFEKK